MAAYQAQFAQMQAQIDGMQLENRLVARSAELRQRGFTEPMIAEFVRRSREEGEAQGMGYAQGLLDAGPAMPPSQWTGELDRQQSDPAEVAAYAAKGPDALAYARTLAASWTRSGGEKQQQTLAEFLQINMAAEFDA